MTNPNVLDTNWIPQIAALGWLIITCDSMISQNRMEITAGRENMAKAVALNQWGRAEQNGTARSIHDPVALHRGG